MPTSARAASAAAVLRAVLLHGPVPRSRIAELSGLSPATVTRLFPLLADRGLLRELGEPEAGQTLGRPRVPVDLDVSGWAVLGVHIGVRRSVFGLLDLRGRLLAAGESEHEDSSPEAVIAQAGARLRAMGERVAGRRRVLGLGVITGGRVDVEGGRLEEQPGLGWHDVDLRAAFARRTGLPVFVDEHVRAMATAEGLFGRARQAGSLGYLYVGNTLGFAYSADGAVHRGSRAAAGEIAHLPLGLRPLAAARTRNAVPTPLAAGASLVRTAGSPLLADPSLTRFPFAHIDTDADLDAGLEADILAPADLAPCVCGARDCFLSLAGERGVTERAVDLGLVPEPRIDLVLKAARAGDELADRLLRDRARNVGAAIAVLLGVLDPELFIVAGRGLTDATEYLPDVRAGARERLRGELPVPIVPTAFGGQVNAVAAASVVIDRVLRDPLAVRVPR
jgi:predicted NBD/HSP70 family sugar kinase